MRIQLPPIPNSPSPMFGRDGPTVAGGKVIRYLPDGADEPVLLTVTVDAELLAEGVPVCTKLVVEPGEYPITRHTLAGIDPRGLARLLFASMGVLPAAASGETNEELRADLRTRPIRHKVTPGRLAEVAAAYRHGGAQGVQLECSVSQSQAYRLIKAARDAGVLPHEEIVEVDTEETSTEETSETEVSS